MDPEEFVRRHKKVIVALPDVRFMVRQPTAADQAWLRELAVRMAAVRRTMLDALQDAFLLAYRDCYGKKQAEKKAWRDARSVTVETMAHLHAGINFDRIRRAHQTKKGQVLASLEEEKGENQRLFREAVMEAQSAGTWIKNPLHTHDPASAEYLLDLARQEGAVYVTGVAGGGKSSWFRDVLVPQGRVVLADLMSAHDLSRVMQIMAESVGLSKDVAQDRTAFVPAFARALAGRVLVVDEFIEVFARSDVMPLWEELCYTNKVPTIFLQVASPGVQDWIPEWLSKYLHHTMRHVRIGMAVPEASYRYMDEDLSGAHRLVPYKFRNEEEKREAEQIKAVFLPLAGHFHDFFGGNLRAVDHTSSRLLAAVTRERPGSIETLEEALWRVSEAVRADGLAAIERGKLFEIPVLGEEFLDKWSGQTDVNYRENYRKMRAEHKLSERIQLMLRIGVGGVDIATLESWAPAEKVIVREMLEYGIMRIEDGRLVLSP